MYMVHMEEEGKNVNSYFLQRSVNSYAVMPHTCGKQGIKEWRQVNEKFIQSKKDIRIVEKAGKQDLSKY